MASIALLIGGVLVNALPFTGSSYLFHRPSADNTDAERKRHDAAIEPYRKLKLNGLISANKELISLIINSG